MRTRRPHDGHCMRLLRRKSSDTPIAPLKREHNDLAAIRTGPVAQSVARTKSVRTAGTTLKINLLCEIKLKKSGDVKGWNDPADGLFLLIENSPQR
jgi:hypothetical protein